MFDLVIRHGTIATAADIMQCDIGIQNGKITALGIDLAAGNIEIDASDRLILPGGIDAHCHLAEPMTGNVVMADDFYSGTVAAACGGTTTIIPFARQFKGQSLKAAVAYAHVRQRVRPSLTMLSIPSLLTPLQKY